ncbi:hypothetical protein AY599_01330 [Leptolyngbya valderiana BDU 20041]|nr:hypothetical protein AY599_01330 [Leptolyngbya valderiana BDU 20041]
MTSLARTILTTLLALATAAALFLVGGSSINGCLWDSDTLRTEATGAPGLVETIVGRFDRYPPLYYEMRLERVATELDADPTDHSKNLAAYDDAGVACDRLGRHDEAIEWMSRKRTALDALPASEERTEHEYRYLANLGTFHAHRWIAAGADRSDMADIERARDLIAQAIELNPDAHFGRERYQLMALEWILEPTHVESAWPYELTSIIEAGLTPDDGWHGRSYNDILADAGYADAPEGFAGLVALGNGWHSFDVFHALALALQDRRDSSLAYLAWLRAEEIARSGGGTLHPDMDLRDFDAGEHPYHLDGSDQPPVEAFYTKARAEADAWHAARTQYIMARLERGEHPDTHPGFFAAWVEPSSMPALPNGLFGLQGTRLTMAAIFAVVLGVPAILIILAIAIPILLARRNRRRAAAAGPENPAPTSTTTIS